MALCFTSLHTVHEPRSVVTNLFESQNVSGAGVNFCTASVAREIGENQLSLLVQSGTSLTLTQVFQLSSVSVYGKAKFSHGYLHDLESRFDFRLFCARSRRCHDKEVLHLCSSFHCSLPAFSFWTPFHFHAVDCNSHRLRQSFPLLHKRSLYRDKRRSFSSVPEQPNGFPSRIRLEHIRQ